MTGVLVLSLTALYAAGALLAGVRITGRSVRVSVDVCLLWPLALVLGTLVLAWHRVRGPKGDGP